MTQGSDAESTTSLCSSCHRDIGRVDGAGDGEMETFCQSCGALINFDGRRASISVRGHDAGEVAAVSGQLARDIVARREAARLRSPWISGSFYLAVAVVVVAMLLVVARVLSIWALPAVLVAALLLVMAVGAYQLRQDDRLTERGFLALMTDVLKTLPLVAKRASGRSNDPVDGPKAPASD